MTEPQEPREPIGEVYVAPAATSVPDITADDWISVGWVTGDGLKWIVVDKGKPKV